MNKIYIASIIALGFILSGCDSGGKKIVDTKDGVVVTTPTGDLYKIVGTELFEIRKHETGYEDGFLKTSEYDIPTLNAKLHCLVKAKVFSNKTDYIIEVTVLPNSIKEESLAAKDLLELKNGTIDGLSVILTSFEDAEGFKLGEDEFNLNAAGWSRVVDTKNETYQYQFKGFRDSEKQRAKKDSTMQIKWVGLS